MCRSKAEPPDNKNGCLGVLCRPFCLQPRYYGLPSLLKFDGPTSPGANYEKYDFSENRKVQNPPGWWVFLLTVQTVVETVEQLSSLSSSVSGGGSAERGHNQGPEGKEQDAQNIVANNDANEHNMATSWEQAAHNANIGKPQVGGFDYTDPATGTPMTCLHQLRSIDGDGIARWFCGGEAAWCTVCNSDNVSTKNISYFCEYIDS